MTVQFNIDSRHNEDARFRKVLFGYDGELLEVELNELQDIMNARLSEVVDNIFGTRPLYTGTYTLSGSVLTIANEVVIGNRELILLTSSAITVASGDSIYLNIQDKTLAKTDSVKKYGDQGSNTTVSNYMQDTRITDETTRRVQTTFQLVKVNTNPGTNILLCTISGSTVNKQATSSFADSNLYKEIRRMASEQITSSGVQANQMAFSNVKVGTTTIAADTTTDTIELVAGTAVTLTPDATNDKVTIAVPNATSSVDGSLSKTDKAKLDGIATGADAVSSSATNGNIKINSTETTVYTHPSGDGNQHVPATGTTNNTKVLKAGSAAGSAAWGAVNASEVVTDANNRFVADTDKTNWNGKASTAVATESANGLQSAADKTKLDGIDTGATNQDNTHYVYAKLVSAVNVGSANTLYNLNVQTGSQVQFYKGMTINNTTNAINITEAGKYLVTLNVTYSGADSAQFVDALIRRTLAGGTIQDVVTTQQGATGAGGNNGGWNVTQTRILDLGVGDALTFYGRSSVAPRTITDYFIDVVRISA